MGMSDSLIKVFFVCHHSLCWGHILHLVPALFSYAFTLPSLHRCNENIFALVFMFYTGHLLFSQCGLTAVHLIDRYIYVKVIEVREVCSRKKGARGGLYPPPPIF